MATAAFLLFVLKRIGLHDAAGTPAGPAPKTLGRGLRYIVGGMLFGVGRLLTGACPGPLVALVGAGGPVMGVTVLSALLGTWT